MKYHGDQEKVDTMQEEEAMEGLILKTTRATTESRVFTC